MNARRLQRESYSLIPLLSDLFALLLAWTVMTMLVDAAPSPILLLVSVITFPIFQLSAGVYRLAGIIPAGRECRMTSRSLVLGAATVLTVALLTDGGFPTQTALLMFLLLLPPALLIVHSPRWYLSLRSRNRYPGIRTMILGSEPGVSRLTDLVRTLPRFDLVAVTEVVRPQADDRGAAIPSHVKEQIVRAEVELLLVSSQDLNGSVAEFHEFTSATGVAVRVVPSEAEFLSSQRGIEDLPTIPVSPDTSATGAGTWGHRLFDLFCCALIGAALSPAFLLIAVAVRLTSAGPVLFQQKRSINDRVRPFTVYKFRSMNDRRIAPLRSNSHNKLRDDPRVTSLGRLMRRYSIDELPQLLNIFKGEMSLVGPRPLPEEDFAIIRADDTNRSLCEARSGVKPGLTGLWQISGRSDLGFREMLLLDIYYIEHRSILFDLEILLRTIPAVVFGKGAY